MMIGNESDGKTPTSWGRTLVLPRCCFIAKRAPPPQLTCRRRTTHSMNDSSQQFNDDTSQETPNMNEPQQARKHQVQE